jgi:hypothetical protein
MSRPFPYVCETAFAGGNAVVLGSAGGADCDEFHFSAHPRGSPEALWFRFRLRRESAAPAPLLRLVLRHSGDLLGFGNPGAVRIVVRADDGEWRRTEPGARVDAPDGQVHAAWQVRAPARTLDVAFCYPYGRDEMTTLVSETAGRLCADTIGVTQGGREIVRLSNAVGETGSGRPGLYFVARQHSGETPGSWVLDGLLRRCAALDARGPLVWAVPFCDPDGVEAGDYGKDRLPMDMNRAWGHPPMRHETMVVKRDIRRWMERCRPVAIVDLHAPGACETAGGYFFVFAAEPDWDARLTAMAHALARALGAFAAADPARRANYPSRWSSPDLSGAAVTEFKVPGLTLETSYQAAGDRVLDIEDYRQIGVRLLDGLSALAVAGGSIDR